MQELTQPTTLSPAVQRVILAKPRGFCAGVVMAIQAVEDAARCEQQEGHAPVMVYHSIVHNHTVVERLSSGYGVQFIEDLEALPLATGAAAVPQTVVFSAHGVSPAVRAQAQARGLATIDATCPLVTKVHTEAKKYAREGYTILLIGDSAQHQEVIGTRGEAPDQTIIVGVLGKRGAGLHDPYTVTVPDPERVVVLTQTTLSVDDTRRTVDILQARFPALLIPPSEDLCYATKNRQDEVRRIAPQVDAFLVLTSTHSSNGMRLMELAAEFCPRTYRLETAQDIAGLDLSGVQSVGISSAASTPDDLVQELLAHFYALNPALEVIEEGQWENITFRKPKKIEAGLK